MSEGLHRIKIGISSCLLGEKVRYDGGHKLDTFLRDTLGKYVDFVPVCPEFEAGLGVPREAMHLLRTGDSLRLVGVKTAADFTERLTNWAKRRVSELEQEGLSGFVFKSGSPSSGMERVKVYNEAGAFSKTGSGIFARIFMERFPLLPVEDEGRLHDPELRENFIERIFVCRRWRDRGKGASGLVDFHTRHKLLILSHSETIYRRMGKLVARAGTVPLEGLAAEYEKGLMEALRLKATPSKNSNVLEHMLGYFKKDLSAGEKQELLEVISNYRRGVIPLIVPVTLLAHYVRKYDKEYLRDQVYLDPHPLELQLRNHA
jgi:uncharacterized protein YbgA (DUF1722 family)/uncharacterized protein YbbK (DUF523 family)